MGGGIGVGGRVITNLRYPNDITVIAGTKDHISIMERVTETTCEETCLYQCPKDESYDYWRYWRSHSECDNCGGGNELRTCRSVDHERWTRDKDIRRRIATRGLITTWKDRAIKLVAKVKIGECIGKVQLHTS